MLYYYGLFQLTGGEYFYALGKKVASVWRDAFLPYALFKKEAAASPIF